MEGMQRAGFSPTTPQPAFAAGGLILLFVTAMYILLGLSLYSRSYIAFRLVAGVLIIVSLLAISVGVLFRLSALLLLIAILLTVRLPKDDVPHTMQEQHNGG